MVKDRRHHNPEGRSDIAKRITGDGYTEGAADYDANRRQVDKCWGLPPSTIAVTMRANAPIIPNNVAMSTMERTDGARTYSFASCCSVSASVGMA